ncbi:hypothetical protein CR513_08682, partial [Mucuna pruriens]
MDWFSNYGNLIIKNDFPRSFTKIDCLENIRELDSWPLRFAFKSSNNEVEYEVLLARMALAREIGVKELIMQSDSQLVTDQ